MKTLFKYYVVETVAEDIVGSFNAVSLDSAMVIFKKGFLDNEKFSDFKDTLRLYTSSIGFELLETYSEVIDACCQM